MKNTYSVLLCTYNGAYFISQQLKSILSQTILPNKIIVSDDGSSDNTLEIVKLVCNEFNFNAFEIIKGNQKGVIYNFLSAIDYLDAPYIFLADQDDIWFPNKAEVFIHAFEKLDKNLPALVFSDALLIDRNEKSISESFFIYQNLTSKVMFDDSVIYRNCVQGASCAINKALQKIIVDSLSQIDINNLYMHDWWIALLARYYGNYYFINQPLISYRQHGKNQIGAFNKKLRFLYYIMRFKPYLKNFKQAIKQMQELEKFTIKYQTVMNSSLRSRNKRKYLYVSIIKRAVIKLLSL